MKDNRRALKPDAQGIDKIIIKTVPRWKESEMSGSEWRISASIEFWRKGKLIKTDGASDIEHAAYLCGALLMKLLDGGIGFFAGEENICDQEGCEETATVTLKKKFDYCQSGHKSESPADSVRMFCSKHKKRGDCGLDDADINYECVRRS